MNNMDDTQRVIKSDRLCIQNDSQYFFLRNFVNLFDEIDKVRLEDQGVIYTIDLMRIKARLIQYEVDKPVIRKTKVVIRDSELW